MRRSPEHAGKRPPEVLPRRRSERDLFFDARWSGDGSVLLYDVAKPGYRPTNPRRVDVAPLLETLILTATEANTPLDSGSCRAALHEPRSAPPGESWFDRLFY